MEELLVYAILLYEGLVTENEYNKRLDELFLNNPENDDLLYLEWETDIKKAIIYVRTHIDYKNLDLERFGSPKDQDLWRKMIMANILFLNIDGVLNSNFWNDSHQREISEGILVDEEKVKLLACLVKKTNAKIILHSGWRTWFDSELKPLRPEAKRLKKFFCG